MLRSARVAFLVFGCALAPASAQRDLGIEKPTPPSVDEAVAAGTRLLVQLQENYVPDRRAPRMRDSEVPKWQAGERKRLARLRAEPEAARIAGGRR